MRNIKSFEHFSEAIASPKINSIVMHTGWDIHGDNKNFYPCNVYMTSGQYLSNGKISNFWYWRRISPDGNLLKEEYGYGDFLAPLVDMPLTYTPQEIKEIYPEKYKEYELKRDAKKYNI